MDVEEKKFSKLIIGIKSLIGVASVVVTRKLFFEIFLKIMLQYDFVDSIVKNLKMSP